MALSGSFTGTTNNQYIQPKITWSATQNIAENYSTVTATLTYSRTNSGYTTSGTWSGSITINETTVTGKSNGQIYITQSSNTFAMSATVKVPHNADGSKSVAISCTGSIPAASLQSTSCAATVTLNAIPRQATITAANNFTDLDNPSFSFSNPGGFAMDVWLEPNPVSDHLCVRKSIKNTGSYTWTLTDTEREQLRNKCAGKSCTIRIGLYSYIGGTTYTSYVDRTFTMKESDATRPSVRVDVSPNNAALPSTFKDVYIQGKSKLNVSISASGKYGASVTSYATTADGKTYTSSSFTSDSIKKSGTIAVASSVKDSRGFTNSASKQITVIPYTIPWITSFSVERQADGATVVARLIGGVSPVENKNTKSFSVTLNGETKSVSSTSYEVDGEVTFTDVPTDVTLTAEAKIEDAFSAVTKNAVVPTIAVTMDFHHSGTGVAFGKVAEYENLLDVAWDIKYKGNLIADFIVEQGISGNWTWRKWNSGIAECWFNGDGQLTYLGQDNGLYVGYGTINFPFTFAGRPTVTYSVYATNGIDYSGKIVLFNDKFNYYIGSNKDLSTISTNKVYAHAIGRWK